MPKQLWFYLVLLVALLFGNDAFAVSKNVDITIVHGMTGTSPDGATSSPPNGTLTDAAGETWTWGTPSLDQPGEYVMLLNGTGTSGLGYVMEIANGGQLYVYTVQGWYLWSGGAFAQTSAPGNALPIISTNPIQPSISDTTPNGTVVATYQVAMTDGSSFTGTVGFGPPHLNSGGVFSLVASTPSNGQIIVNPAGPGVGPQAATITDFVTMAAGTVSKDVGIGIVHPNGTASCPCGANAAPNMCADQASVKAGTPVNVTLVCGPPNATSLNWSIWGWGTPVNSVPLSGQAGATFQMMPPNFALTSPLDVNFYITDANGVDVGDGSHVTLLPNVTQTLAAGLPADEPDPFVPQHTVTVCPSGCQYAHPEDAIIFVMAQTTWDNVLITVDAAEYYTTASAADSNYMFFNSSSMPNHIWVKGIIGNSGTDGTVFPHIWGGNVQTGSSLLTLDGSLTGKTVTIDNFDIGPIISGQLVSDIGGTLNLRNDYLHDSYYLLISNDNINAVTNIYNSHFARGHSHDIYIGAEGGNGSLTIKNSVIEQANAGHDVKSRAPFTELDCNELIIDQDPVYMGSELTDLSEGREGHVHNNVYVTAEGAGDGWVDNQGFDTLRFGADREFGIFPTNILDFSGNTVVVDAGGSGHRMLNVWIPMSPNPPYPISGNTLVYKNASQAGKNPGGPIYFGGHNDEISAPIAIVNDTGSGTTANELTYVNGTVYPSRAAAGLPAALPTGAVVAFNDPSIPSRPAACTDPLGNVKIPAH